MKLNKSQKDLQQTKETSLISRHRNPNVKDVKLRKEKSLCADINGL